MKFAFAIIGLWAMAAAASPAPALAGTMSDPICTDRPGKGSATCTVPKGHFQIETGLADWSLTNAAGERDTELDLGASAIKYGVTDHIHIELDVVPLIRTTSRAAGIHDHASGVGDTLVRVKQELALGDGPWSAALYPYVKLPTASHRLGNGKVEGGLVVPLGLALGKSQWSLSATPEVDAAADADGHGYHPAMAQVFALGWQASDALNLSAEVWGSWDWDPAGTTRKASLDGSAAYRLGSNTQLDGGANFGLNRNTADIELYGGVSTRF